MCKSVKENKKMLRNPGNTRGRVGEGQEEMLSIAVCITLSVKASRNCNYQICKIIYRWYLTWTKRMSSVLRRILHDVGRDNRKISENVVRQQTWFVLVCVCV